MSGRKTRSSGALWIGPRRREACAMLGAVRVTSCHSHGHEAMLLHVRRGLYDRWILAIMHQESYAMSM